jgi:hypothetical protein
MPFDKVRQGNTVAHWACQRSSLPDFSIYAPQSVNKRCQDEERVNRAFLPVGFESLVRKIAQNYPRETIAIEGLFEI